MGTIDVLFVPTHQCGGTGEYFESLALAEALLRREPAARIGFLLQRGERIRLDVPFPSFVHEGEPGDKGRFDSRMIGELKPRLVVFNTTCRTPALRACRRHGVSSVCITNNRGTCRKAFRLDWLFLLDQHWHQRYLVTEPPFRPLQRFKALLSPTRRLVYDCSYSESEADESELPAALRERLQRPFALFIPGGGGYHLEGRPAAEVYYAAAEQLHRRTGVEALTLTGTFFGAEPGRTMTLPEISQALLIQLMRRAAIVVTNGASCLTQALSCGAAVVCTMVGGDDQLERVTKYAQAGIVVATAATADGLAEGAVRLLAEQTSLQSLRLRAGQYRVINGIPLLGNALAEALKPAASWKITGGREPAAGAAEPPSNTLKLGRR